MNFNTKSAYKTTTYNLTFLIALYSDKNDNKEPSQMRNQHRKSYFTVTKFLDPF